MPSVPEIITSNIIEQLERGVAPWRKPWSTSIPRNLTSKKPYRGLNVFLLATQGYGSPYWLTFNQAKQLGAHVRQGEKSTLVSFWKFNEYARENRDMRELETKLRVLHCYRRRCLLKAAALLVFLPVAFRRERACLHLFHTLSSICSLLEFVLNFLIDSSGMRSCSKPGVLPVRALERLNLSHFLTSSMMCP